MQTVMTKRPTNQFMENQMFVEHKLLDHGHIILTDYSGDEASIIENARISYGGGLRKELNNADKFLLRYLMRNHHTSPLESCNIKVRMKLPIFVARQLVRHRTAKINEVSARYTELDNEFYIPAEAIIQPQSTTNKQGRSGQLTTNQKLIIQELISGAATQDFCYYQALLGKKDISSDRYNNNFNKLVEDEEFPGIARELARIGLPLSTYTSWIWTIDLHNLLHFIGLRSDSHAQYEIRVYSDVLFNMIQGWMPNVYQAFHDYRMDAITLSAPEWKIIKHLLNSNDCIPALTNQLKKAKISEREIKELIAKL